MEIKKTDELKNATSEYVASEAVKYLLEHKAIDVKLFYVKETTSVTDYYVNATGRSSTQVSALADEISDNFSERGRDKLRIEGRQGGAWVLVDYGDVIINIFDKPSREFYNLDRHLPENSEIDISHLVEEVDKKFELSNRED